MHIQLTIFERLNDEKPPSVRKRLITVSSDSVTLGSIDSADVQLKSFTKPIFLEIKLSDSEWWIVNPQRTAGIQINKAPLMFESRLAHKDEIQIQGHRIIFEIKESALAEAPKFIEQPNTDEELWLYLLNERDFDEVLINGSQHIYVDWRGVLCKAPWKFSGDDFLIGKIKEHSKVQSGWASWRLNRILRIQAALPPIVEAPHIAIRKAKQNVLSLDQLESSGFGKLEEMDFLRRALKEKQNILISGGTSTGKTVLLRSLIEKVETDERLVIVEEEAEIDWPHPHAVTVEAGRGNLRQSVIESLRMRPSRLIISEVRGGEAFDMLQAMNTGHSGSMTTVHANSAREALARIENLVLMSGVPLTVSAVRRQIAQTIHIIVQLQRDSYGKRSIEQIVRVGGIQNDIILLSEPIGLEAQGIKQKISRID